MITGQCAHLLPQPGGAARHVRLWEEHGRETWVRIPGDDDEFASFRGRVRDLPGRRTGRLLVPATLHVSAGPP